MFRIECFCDDKVLAKIMWALEALHVYNLSAKPVLDVTGKANGQVLPAGAERSSHVIPRDRIPARDAPPLFPAWAKKNKLNKAEIKASDVKEFALSLGFAKGSYSHILDMLQETGALKRKPGTTGTTTVRYLLTGKMKPMPSGPLPSTLRKKKRELRPRKKTAAETKAEAS